MVLDALSRVATGVAILLLGAASACAADVDCMAQPLGPIDTWSIVVNGDLVQSNTDSEGRVAAGRDVTLTSYGVASQLPVDGSRVDLVAGRDLTGSNLVVDHGSVSYGRNLYGSVTAPNGTVTRAAPQQDFATLFSAAEARSTVWGALTPDGTVSGPVYGALTLTGESTKLNVFTIAASTLQQAQRILIKVPFGSSTLINVTGTTYTTAQYPTTSVEFWNGSSFQQFGNAAPSPELEAMRRAMLWNFPDATDVQIGPSLAWQGSVLAPQANMRFVANTQLNGTIVAGALYGDGETHLHPPTGICLPEPPPCPPVDTIDPPDPIDPVNPVTPPTPPAPVPEPLGPSSPSEPSPRTPGEVLGTGDTSTSVAGTADAGAVGICKKVMSPNGRALERLRARAGDTVRFRVRVTNLGTRLLRNVRVCDRIPSGLVLVSAPGSPRLVGGRLCWTLKTLPSQRQGFATLRITRTTPGLVLNTVSVTTSNGGSARDTAGVRVLAARSSPGGVTG